MKYQLFCGDAREVLKTLPANGIDCVVAAPPYGVLIGEANNGQRREKNQQAYSTFSDTPEYIVEVVVPVIAQCIERFGRIYGIILRPTILVAGLFRRRPVEASGVLPV